MESTGLPKSEMVIPRSATTRDLSSPGRPALRGALGFWVRVLSSASTHARRILTYRVLYLYSEVPMLAIRLPQSIEKRLEKLARLTGRTKTFYVREAILEHLDDLEGVYLAERILGRIRSGKERTIPLEDALKRYGLED